MGALWQFASAANLALFKADPEKYAPQYGGHCANGVSQDKLVSIEPDKFKIVEGKLYLNHNAEVQAKWLKDPAGFIQSLFFKFSGWPETVYIFQGKLDLWAASLGFAGVFAPGGLFSTRVVGSVELIASLLLLAGAAMSAQRAVQGLGVAVVNADGSSDGGELFALACGVWLAYALLLWLHRALWLGWIARATGRG